MDCPFCDRRMLERRGIIAETKSFIVTPTLGQIVEGYSLIIPKKHYLCYGQMPKSLLEEYIGLKQKLEAAVIAGYQNPMYFEHGIAGQEIPHAHMHCAPSNKDLLQMLMHYYHVHKELSSETELKEVVKEYGAYYFYESGGRKFAFDVNTNKGAMRHALAAAHGIPEAADWRNVNKEDDEKSMQRTVEKLRPFFK